MRARDLPWAHDEGTDLFLLGVDPLGEPVLNALGRSIHGVWKGELVPKIHELRFKDLKEMGKFGGYYDEM